MATATPADALTALCEDFVNLIQAAIDREIADGDAQPKRITLEHVEIYDAVPVNVYCRELTRRQGESNQRTIWSATLETTDGSTYRRDLSATYRIFYHS